MPLPLLLDWAGLKPNRSRCRPGVIFFQGFLHIDLIIIALRYLKFYILILIRKIFKILYFSIYMSFSFRNLTFCSVNFVIPLDLDIKAWKMTVNFSLFFSFFLILLPYSHFSWIQPFILDFFFPSMLSSSNERQTSLYSFLEP